MTHDRSLRAPGSRRRRREPGAQGMPGEVAFESDSGGAGRFRGGLGLRRSYRLLADEAVLQLRADRLRFAPPYDYNPSPHLTTNRHSLKAAFMRSAFLAAIP